MEGITETIELASNKKIKIGDTPKDNIGRLPDALLHHILSFMDMREVLQTSFLSKRWRHTWKSLQVLNFDYSLWEPEEKSSSLSSSQKKKKKKRILRPYVKRVLSKEGCMDFVDRAIYLFRDRTANIQKLKLSEHYCRDKGRLETLLLHVLPNIKEIHLEGNNKLPPILFTSKKLEVFVLANKIGKFIYPVQLPVTICSNSHLTTLSLQRCVLPRLRTTDGNGELELKNPVLKKLALINCDHYKIKVINITAPQLKELVVENSPIGVVYDYSESVRTCKLNLCTPSLLLLRLEGQPYMDLSFEDLSSLVTADIGFTEEPQLPVNFLSWLCCLRNASKLKLYLDLSKTNNVLHEPLRLFRNLRHLTLGRVSCIRTVIKVLQNCPSVETLVIEGIDMLTNFEEECWKMELPTQDKFHHLRCFKNAGCSHLLENELKLLTFMLKNSTALENIAVTYMVSELETKGLTDFKHKLGSLLEESSKVKIHFIELD